jgi:TRAP-type C4-dicarboxylate transport system permease small subunit
MSHGFELEGAVKTPEIPATGMLGGINRLLQGLNTAIMFLSSIALLGASLILCSSVFLRYFLKIPTDWQDEMSVFLLVGATFMCAAYVQSQRGHIGIEAVASLLPPLVNRLRLIFCDLVSFLFCSFFSWKSMLLLLWIPYGFMTLGMTLLSLQLLLQLVAGIVRKEQ